ncbi:PCC domain-containing protein [Prauserella rugosa]|uniref:Putative DNA-binding protein with PD1-like motif n=1 Tax=Prauserella rugosa TaxID=43354 RepID=A0A660CBP7_9PSEU|nr:DUF296 domain-containing protein [Prauserella rugosa]KID29583.1 putative DNA-binding protein with PD1-like DNA-binding motif [Prauserella sp. Am3]KMS89594.1 hypothetical protein ACZ91_19620 [Streptomyces regensis]TWH18351.1 putative DNA-binding protein with PD1-like motif [Prauserella rugosa]
MTDVAGRPGVPLHHPGRPAAERIVSVPTDVTVLRTELPPGERVAEALWRLTEGVGAAAASVELAHGSFGTLRYVHPAIGTERPAYFSETVEPEGPCFVLTGSATVGRRDGAGFAHVHATWLDERGRLRGGHLLPDTTVGTVPIEATLRVLSDVDLVSETCAETEMPAFTPYRRTPATRIRAVSSRIRPGEDLCTAVATVARRAGFDSALVRASLGSLVGARLRSGAGEPVEVDWPASEVTSLTGTVRGEDVALVASMVDRHGEVFSGVILPGENPVAVTFELYLEDAGVQNGTEGAIS